MSEKPCAPDLRLVAHEERDEEPMDLMEKGGVHSSTKTWTKTKRGKDLAAAAVVGFCELCVGLVLFVLCLVYTGILGGLLLLRWFIWRVFYAIQLFFFIILIHGLYLKYWKYFK